MSSGFRSADPATLLEAALQGDLAARQRLVLRRHRELMAIVRADLSPRVRTHLDPEDLIQEIYTAALQGFDGFAGRTPAAFAAWMNTIARNKVRQVGRRLLDAARRDVRREQRSAAGPFSQTGAPLVNALEAHMTTVAGKAVRIEALDALAAALALLPEHYREVIKLRHLDGLSVDEAAARTGRTRGSVLMITQRAMRQMAKTIKEFPLLTGS
ncbi:MAG: sigma-70 family RNA polymerase sigma factor [bacterium]|nr:sigma-70 family RNA polymerase sigma factor [bacterium]